MSVVEVCEKCGGSGWKILEREGISGAERCECAGAERDRRVLERANIPSLYQNKSLDNFRIPEDNPQHVPTFRLAMRDVKTYIDRYPFNVDKPGLLFIGPPGIGKTHLAISALRGLLARGFEGIFFDYQTLLNHIRSGYDEASGTMDRDAFRLALEMPVLVLDDVGAHRVKDWVEDTVTSIITHRCNQERATIVTTNQRDPEAGDQRGSGLQEDLHAKYFLEERIGTRARSRLFEMCKLVKMPYAEDYRLKHR